MQVGADALAAIANHWLARFEQALATGEEPALAQLFNADAHWRDVLAFGWRLRTVSGAATIARTLKSEARETRATGFRTDPERKCDYCDKRKPWRFSKAPKRET